MVSGKAWFQSPNHAKKGDCNDLRVNYRHEKHDGVIARKASDSKGRNPTYDDSVQPTQTVGLKLNNDVKATLSTSDLQEITNVIQNLGSKD